MKQWVKWYFFALLSMPSLTFAASIEVGDYWQCNTHDNSYKTWSARNSYQRVALNLAYAACKKQSQNPASCVAATTDCEQYINDTSTKPIWYCIALDSAAIVWKSNYYTKIDDAALAAKAYCQDKSSVPGTCYVPMVACVNINT